MTLYVKRGNDNLSNSYIYKGLGNNEFFRYKTELTVIYTWEYSKSYMKKLKVRR